MSSRSLQRPTDAESTLTPVGPHDRRGQPLRWLIPMLAALGAGACGESAGSRGSNQDAMSDPDTSTTPVRRLTSGGTTLTNLNSRIRGLRGAVAAQPTVAALRAELVANLLTRTQFVGSFQDLGESSSLAAEGRRASSELERAIEIEATALGSVHEFARAVDLLASLALTENDTTLGNLRLARGDDPRPIEAARRERAAENPSFDSLSSWAIALSAVGEFDAADAAYADALRHYRDVSPLPVAWLAFQRGVMWAERAGEPARGRAFYEEATRVLPEYVVANVHLAEIEASDGDVSGARSRLARVIEAGTEDPEPYGLLAELAASELERDRLRELTEARYRALIDRYPKAFLDHGAEFFSTVDPEFALDLALRNLENRTEDRAYQIALEAARAADATDVLCDLAQRASLDAHPGFARPSVPLRQLAQEVLGACE